MPARLAEGLAEVAERVLITGKRECETDDLVNVGDRSDAPAGGCDEAGAAGGGRVVADGEGTEQQPPPPPATEFRSHPPWRQSSLSATQGSEPTVLVEPAAAVAAAMGPRHAVDFGSCKAGPGRSAVDAGAGAEQRRPPAQRQQSRASSQDDASNVTFDPNVTMAEEVAGDTRRGSTVLVGGWPQCGLEDHLRLQGLQACSSSQAGDGITLGSVDPADVEEHEDLVEIIGVLSITPSVPTETVDSMLDSPCDGDRDGEELNDSHLASSRARSSRSDSELEPFTEHRYRLESLHEARQMALPVDTYSVQSGACSPPPSQTTSPSTENFRLGSECNSVRDSRGRGHRHAWVPAISKPTLFSRVKDSQSLSPTRTPPRSACSTPRRRPEQCFQDLYADAADRRRRSRERREESEQLSLCELRAMRESSVHSARRYQCSDKRGVISRSRDHRRRREELLAAAAEEKRARQDEEMQECTFRPAINSSRRSNPSPSRRSSRDDRDLERRLRQMAHRQLDCRARIVQLDGDWSELCHRGEVTDQQLLNEEAEYRARRRVLEQALEDIEARAAPLLRSVHQTPQAQTLLAGSGFKVDLAEQVRGARVEAPSLWGHDAPRAASAAGSRPAPAGAANVALVAPTARRDAAHGRDAAVPEGPPLPSMAPAPRVVCRSVMPSTQPYVSSVSMQPSMEMEQTSRSTSASTFTPWSSKASTISPTVWRGIGRT